MLFYSRLAILVITMRTKWYRWLAAPGVWCDLEGCRPAEHRLTALNWCSLLADTSMLIIFQARNPRRHPLLLQKGIWGCMIQVKIWPSPEDHRWGHHQGTGLVKVILSPPIRKPSSLSKLGHDNKGLKNIICRYPGSWCLQGTGSCWWTLNISWSSPAILQLPLCV